MRYFEADDTAIKLDPKTVVALGAASGTAILVMSVYFGLWP